MEYYIFNDEQTALEAEAFIAEKGFMPITSTNAQTGELTPNKQKTEKWATLQQRLDGKWVFPRLPAEVLENVALEDKTYFFNAFSPVIEDYEADWFPAEEI